MRNMSICTECPSHTNTGGSQRGRLCIIKWRWVNITIGHLLAEGFALCFARSPECATEEQDYHGWRVVKADDSIFTKAWTHGRLPVWGGRAEREAGTDARGRGAGVRMTATLRRHAGFETHWGRGSKESGRRVWWKRVWPFGGGKHMFWHSSGHRTVKLYTTAEPEWVSFFFYGRAEKNI